MPTIVSDNFNKADNPTSLGTADTGQAWNQVSGLSGAFGINSNEALWTWTNVGDPPGQVVVESGSTDGITQVTLVDPGTITNNFGISHGIVFRRVSVLYYWQLVYYQFPGPAPRLRLQRFYNSGTAFTAIDLGVTLVAGDTIACAYCGPALEVFINGVSQGTYDDSPNPQNYGTQCGLVGAPGSYFGLITKRFNNFLVETNSNCPVALWPLPPLGWVATGTVTHAGPPTSTTATFDGSGAGSTYFLVPQLSDHGDELRDKCTKSLVVTGKLTNAKAKVYGHGPRSNINVSDIEQGINPIVEVPLATTTMVQRSKRHQVNCPNLMMGTVRIEGTWDGTGERDRIDEIVTEVAGQGVRR